MIGRDVRAGLLEPEREASEFARKRTGLSLVIHCHVATAGRALQQEMRRRIFVERVEFELAYATRKIPRP